MIRIFRFSPMRAAVAAAALLLATTPARAQQADEPDTQPELLNERNLARLASRAFPASMRGRRAPATVEVKMKILADGTVDSTSVSIHSSPEPEFNEPAARVAMQLRFKPATLAGEPVPVWVTYPITFIRHWDSAGHARDIQRDDRQLRGDIPPPKP
ncbi:MAG TPA: energy transducer TonB [Longimicrobium sp.]|nr:energy transducer TonB [Longimicrobium sp.]